MNDLQLACLHSQVSIPIRSLHTIGQILVSLSLPEHISKLFQWTPIQLSLFPQIGRQETVTVAHGDERSLQRVFKSLGTASGRGVGVLDAS